MSPEEKKSLSQEVGKAAAYGAHVRGGNILAAMEAAANVVKVCGLQANIPPARFDALLLALTQDYQAQWDLERSRESEGKRSG